MTTEYTLAKEVLAIEKAEMALREITDALKLRFTIQDWAFYNDVKAQRG